MYKIFFKLSLISLLLIILIQSKSIAQNSTGTASRTILTTLQSGEIILSAECYFTLTVSQNQFYLVTRQNNKYFVYENGQRKGPFSDLGQANVKVYGAGKTGDEKCSLHKPAPVTIPSNEVTTNDMGQFVIKLKGKTYGPYQFLSNVHIFPDKSGFVAIAFDQTMKQTLISSDGPNVPIDGTIDKIHISPFGKKYLYVLKESFETDPAILAEKMSKMTQEQLLKYVQEQAAKQAAQGKPKAYVHVSGGGKFGPYEQDPFWENNPAFTKTGGDNWIMTMNNSLYINGIKIKTFENFDLNTCNVWLSKDGKRYAVTSYDQIIFSDGKTFKYPLEISAYEKDGKTFLKWVSLENQKDLALYSREI